MDDASRAFVFKPPTQILYLPDTQSKAFGRFLVCQLTAIQLFKNMDAAQLLFGEDLCGKTFVFFIFSQYRMREGVQFSFGTTHAILIRE